MALDSPTNSKPGLIVRSEAPFNAEPPLDRLRTGFVTGLPDFFVRSHGDVPTVDPATYRLTVEGLVATPLRLSLDALAIRFERHAVTAVIQCAGNRRMDLQAVRPTAGNAWSAGAIGNGVWSGYRLRDVLRAAGASTDSGRHVAFNSLDLCRTERGLHPYGVSIEIEKALDADVLLADRLNGEPLPPVHGFPLRAVVPGFAGARSAKWLASLEVRAMASDNFFQEDDYLLIPPDHEDDASGRAAATRIDAMPVNAAICDPADGARVGAGLVRVAGYAVASDAAITHVELSADEGRTWRDCTLTHQGPLWAWSFWEIAFPLAPGRHVLTVRATDAAGRTQPADAEAIWNCRGYLGNAWHRVSVQVA